MSKSEKENLKFKVTKKLVSVLEEEELKLRAQLLENATDAIYLRDYDGNFIYVNETAYKSLGYTREELMKMNMYQLHTPERAKDKAIFKLLKENGSIKFEGINIRKDGSIIPVEVHDRIIEWGGRKLVLGVVRDITENKQAESKLRDAEARYRILFEQSPDSVLIVDPETTEVIEFNDTACKQLGYSRDEFAKMKISDFDVLATPDQLKKIAAEIKRLGRFESITKHRTKQGEIRAVIVLSKPIEISGKQFHLAIHHDITEQYRMREKLIIADRLASLGELASGFAHELNNPLTAVIGYSQLLLDDKNLTENLRTDVERIYSQTQRMAALIKNFLVFARRQTLAKQPTDINSVINAVLKLREYEDKVKNINIITKLSPDLPAIIADASQLQQVFLNIVINAEYFMLKAHNRGTLTVTTERTEDIVKISFADDGPGIPQENLANIFNPFFTTKEVGQGTGLGLSICYGIITEHGGRIYVESKLGKGTTFVVELPVAE